MEIYRIGGTKYDAKNKKPICRFYGLWFTT